MTKQSISTNLNPFQQISIALVFVLTYTPTFLWMWDRWFVRDSYYSHGILIPFFSAYLIWLKKEELARIPVESSPWGMRLIILGITIHLLSSILRIYFSSGFSMLIVLVGLILHLYGNQILKAVAFPVGFLIFMVPVPMVVIANISFTMKMFAAQIATVMLNNMGILALREGSLIKMQHAFVMVEDVCSGLRSLISLAALGSIFAYWIKGPVWKKLLLFASTIPIAVVTNVVRVIFLAVIAEVWGAKYIEGFLHDLSGYLIFAVAFLLLWVVTKMLE